ncbi:MAG: hypothetical protein GXN99_00835 [Candidatus Nanohaloarchaeota archaeon]|nr:hypothetical protein [Candidatus Nanohaloarchaeota archaeon]
MDELTFQHAYEEIKRWYTLMGLNVSLPKKESYFSLHLDNLENLLPSYVACDERGEYRGYNIPLASYFATVHKALKEGNLTEYFNPLHYFNKKYFMDESKNIAIFLFKLLQKEEIPLIKHIFIQTKVFSVFVPDWLFQLTYLKENL